MSWLLGTNRFFFDASDPISIILLILPRPYGLLLILNFTDASVHIKKDLIHINA